MPIFLRKVSKPHGPVAPKTAGAVVINCLSWHESNGLKTKAPDGTLHVIDAYEFSPYHLRDPRTECLFENIWQGCKLYPKVFPVHDSRTGFAYAGEEHVLDSKRPLPEVFILPGYWNWRRTVMTFPKPLRYPEWVQGPPDVPRSDLAARRTQRRGKLFAPGGVCAAPLFRGAERDLLQDIRAPCHANRRLCSAQGPL